MAHTAKINCLRIGRKSGRVLVTGGEDKCVNMWAIGKPNVVMSLSGHSSGVEAVCFDANEEHVVAGTSGGGLKLWDLDLQKPVRSLLNGHKSNCISLDFHPIGEFFASGSIDTDLKIWDIRRKGCIQTYRGHTQAVNSIRFSPDGKWVVSGGEDGLVKLWDLTAGKILHEFQQHQAPITEMGFHPHEFLFTTASADGVIKFWDLETFELVSSTSEDSSYQKQVVKCFTFSPDGVALCAAEPDCLRVVGYEPIKIFDSVNVPWNNVADMNITKDQLIACSIQQSHYSVWVVNITKLKPFNSEVYASSLEQESFPKIEIEPVPVSRNVPDVKAPKNTVPTKHEVDIFPVKEDKPVSKPVQVSTQPNVNSEDISPPKSESSESIVDNLISTHSSVMQILTTRQANLKLIRNIWSKGDIRETVEIIGSIGDYGVICDVLNILLEKPNLISLDICVILLPIVSNLLDDRSPHSETHILVSLRAIKLLAESFGPVIKSFLEAPVSRGVDLQREQRMEKGNACLTQFKNILKKLEGNITPKIGKVGHLAKEVVALLKGLIQEK